MKNLQLLKAVQKTTQETYLNNSYETVSDICTQVKDRFLDIDCRWWEKMMTLNCFYQ